MKCHCTQNHERLALLVGQDAVPELPEEIRRSLTNCPHCREHYQQLCASQQVLQRVHEEETCSLTASLWPSLARRLPEARPALSYRKESFKQRFVPVFSMAAACLAVLLVFMETRDSNTRIYQTAVNRPNSSMALPLTPVGNSFAESSSGFYDQSLTPSRYESPYEQQMSRQLHSFEESAQGPVQEDRLFDFLRSEFSRDLQQLQK